MLLLNVLEASLSRGERAEFLYTGLLPVHSAVLQTTFGRRGVLVLFVF